MKTSVIIVNWNGKHHLEHCLPALHQQTLAPDEVIIVDNASSDDSVEYLRTNYPEIRLVELNENRGFSGGNIAGYEVATSDYIILLNNDTKPLPDWLEQLVTCADVHKGVGIVASVMTDWEGILVDTAGDGCSVTGRGFKLHKGQSANIPISDGYVFSACAGAALYKRAMLNEIGFLDGRFFMNGEDTDLAFRAQLRGWKAYLCSGAIVRHRISASQGIFSDASLHYNIRNHVLLYTKCMPTRLMLKYLILVLVEVTGIGLYFAVRKQSKAYITGLWAGIKLLPTIWSERKTVQSSMRASVQDIEQQLSWPKYRLSSFTKLFINRSS